jgi:hypothetical protein
MLLWTNVGDHYSQLKETMEGRLNGIVNEINKEKISGSSPSH